MPSSMIFAVLVVIWLLILVPAVARHRQEVERPTVAALSGRVLERPRRRQNLEVDVMDDPQHSRAVATEAEDVDVDVDVDDGYPTDSDFDTDSDVDDHGPDDYADPGDDRRWERPPPRYRPGRGGYDPEAAALAARARYAFRQRVVLAMLVVAVVTAVVAAVAVPGLWWPHAAVDTSLVGYLVYLRRQVRMEESIRDRRAARMAGTRRPPAAADPELDEWAQRGRDETLPEADGTLNGTAQEIDGYEDLDEPAPDELAAEDPERVVGVGEPLAALRERDPEPVPALPRLQPAPPPPLPPGTALVEADDEDPELHEFGATTRPDYRRAVGE